MPSQDVLGPPKRRKKPVIVGDTETIEDLADHVRDPDVLVIEATFLSRDAAIARDYGHLTAAEAATLAAMSSVKILVLTHISGRYPDDEILAEATKIFPNSRLAIDFDRTPSNPPTRQPPSRRQVTDRGPASASAAGVRSSTPSTRIACGPLDGLFHLAEGVIHSKI
jgi:hypothetical protein